ncbi:hypothetical protein [Microvirga ossetica]|nr:hypothetical protein [Microvirga ossetica]
MTFLIQFKRFRRGVPEVIGTLPIAAADGAAALAFARSVAGMRRWPSRTDALRVMDDGGRILLDWTVPVAAAQPLTSSTSPVPTKPAGKEPRPAPLMTAEHPEDSPSTPTLGQHRFAVGQAVSYAEDGQPEIWKGGYEIVRLDDPHHGPRYAIRSADQSYDRIVHEHELREDLGARGRGR